MCPPHLPWPWPLAPEHFTWHFLSSMRAPVAPLTNLLPQIPMSELLSWQGLGKNKKQLTSIPERLDYQYLCVSLKLTKDSPSFDSSILKRLARSNALLDSQLGIRFRKSIESMEPGGCNVLDAADIRFMLRKKLSKYTKECKRTHMRHWDSDGSGRSR